MSQEILPVASRQGCIAEGSIEAVNKVTDNTTTTAEMPVGACWTEGRVLHQYYVQTIAL
jgi:hypothetical protein